MKSSIEWKYIGELLVNHGYISRKILQDALSDQEKSRELIGQIIVKKNQLRELKLDFVLKEQNNLAVNNVEKFAFLPLDEIQYTIIDVLTTGINYDAGARICEISMIKVKGDKILSQVRKPIKIETELPILLKNVFECSNEVADIEFNLEYFREMINQYVKGEILVGFSLPFIFDFVIKQLKGKITLRDSVLVDLHTIWRRLNLGPGRGYISFIKFAKQFGMDIVPPYNSLKNCLVVKEILRKMINEVNNADVRNLEELLRFQDRNFYFGIQEKVDVPPEINDAIENKQELEIEYYSPWTQERTYRKVDPYELIFRENTAYLLAYCYLRKEFRTFKIDRIGKIVKLESKYITRKKPPFWEQ